MRQMLGFVFLLSSCGGFQFGKNTQQTALIEGSETSNPEDVISSPDETSRALGLTQSALIGSDLSCLYCHAKIHSGVVTDNLQSAKDILRADELDGQLMTLNEFASQLGTGIGGGLGRDGKLLNASARFFSDIQISPPTESEMNSLLGTISGRYRTMGPESSFENTQFHQDSTADVSILKSVQCEGDIALKGQWVLFETKVSTINGCRLYTNQALLIIGNTVNSGGPNSHIQIASSHSIYIGSEVISSLMKSGDFTQITQFGSRFPNIKSTQVIQLQKMFLTAPDVFGFRFVPNMASALGINTYFEGAIIGDSLVINPGSFTYRFEPLFSRVPILPKLARALFSLTE